MELTTFGAVLGFAIEQERAASQLYAEASRDPRSGGLAALFSEAATEKRAHVGWLERSRREQVAEMILVPISDLRDEAFLPSPPTDLERSQILDRMIDREEAAHRFYRVAAQRIGLPEVAKLLERIAGRTASRRLVLEQGRAPFGAGGPGRHPDRR
ncbi:MAG: hypothetical protein HY613_00510 [Candidatus Rokubacteria bacterium]|nr:hypothetical protein [Candidatus Rokubacteria bacterium]